MAEKENQVFEYVALKVVAGEEPELLTKEVGLIYAKDIAGVKMAVSRIFNPVDVSELEVIVRPFVRR